MTEPITPRQRQVAELKKQGLIDIEIARLLGITVDTVRSHRTPKHMSRYTGVGQGWRRGQREDRW